MDDEKMNINSSFDSKDIDNKNSRNNDIDLPKSRLSSASSKKHQEQQSTYINKSFSNESSKETRIKSPNNSYQNTNQLSNHKLTNENQSTFDSLDHEEQPTFNNHSRSSFHINEISNHGPTVDQLNSTKNSLDVKTNDDDLPPSRRQKTRAKDDQNLSNPTGDKKKINQSVTEHWACKFSTEKNKRWLDLLYHEQKSNGESDETEPRRIKKPDELEAEMEDPPDKIDEKLLDRIQGSIIGMALADALGAHVEFRPHQYMVEHPVKDLESGGTWGLEKGQFTDDTSMALCLANSLIARKDFVPYDQLVRYKWWSEYGYMSSTGKCFDIGAATSQSIHEFQRRQKKFAEEKDIPFNLIDKLSDPKLLDEFEVYCSEDGVAGNGALMRLAPVPLFFFRNKYAAIEFSGRSGQITHGDKQSYDACRFYGALIVAALRGFNKEQILAKNFYCDHRHWFGEEPLHEKIKAIAEGSYKKKFGWEGGIRGKGYIVNALEAALWAFWSDECSFEKGALAAINLGDDTDTTAAIYGQLAGAYYGYKKLPSKWVKQVYARKFMETLSKWIAYEGKQWEDNRYSSFTNE